MLLVIPVFTAELLWVRKEKKCGPRREKENQNINAGIKAEKCRVVLAQGMLEKKTNSYHSKSRGNHPTEGRRQGGQPTSCGEGI